jgi:threonine/homoserine/homoserine lactone efflux protein
MTFLQAALFQWVNPKAWTMALTAISVYAPTGEFRSVLVVAVVFGLVNIPSVSTWVIMGQALSRFLKHVLIYRIFNHSMALLLLLSLYPAFFM